MTKILVMPSNPNINDIKANSFLFGIKGLSVNMPYYCDLEEIIEICKTDKEIFVSINKNMHNEDLINLEHVLKQLNKLNIKGIFYYDVAVLNISKKINSKIDLVWSGEHLTTNYSTINFWNNKGVTYTYLSSEITLEEIIDIKNNTNSKLIVPLFGYLPMFVSERHTVKNYLKTFNLKDNSKINYMNLEDNDYPIVDNELGTNIYSSHILNGYEEYKILKKHNIEYVTLNSFNIESEKFMKVVDIFINEKDYEIEKLFDNIDKGFLYKETIYKVKKYE